MRNFLNHTNVWVVIGLHAELGRGMAMNCYASEDDCKSKLGKLMQRFRAERPSEWMMDDFIREVEKLSADAERYRWLRSTTNHATSNGEKIDVKNNPELWDSAIDECIAEANKLSI